MSNVNQNNEIESINNELNLLQDRLKINEKSLNQFQTKKVQKILKDIFKNQINLIKKKSNILKNALVNVQNRKRLLEKGLKKIAKMQNLLQNEFNQIAKMRDLSRDELEQITKIRRIKNYEDMKNKGLIISLLK